MTNASPTPVARNAPFYATLLVAYCYVPSFRFLLVILVPFHTDPYYDQFWYAGPALHLVPPFLACLIVGWISGWRKSLAHGIGMGAATVLAYALIDLVEQPATHADPITFETGAWYFAGLSAFYLSGTLTGALLRSAWVKVTQSNEPADL